MKSTKTKNGEERAPSLGSESASHEATKSKTPKYAAPEGYAQQTDSIAGFWPPSDGPIHFIPQQVRLSDSKLDPSKPSVLILGELVDPRELMTRDGEIVMTHAGETVGVWYKPGMSALKELAGVKVFMFEDGELDTGKPSKMKLYEVCAAKKGAKLQVAADNRKKSKMAATAFTEAPASRSGAEVPEGEL